MDAVKKFSIFYSIFLFLIVVALLVISFTESLFLKPYKRKYSPVGINDGQNKSPYTPI